MSQENLGESVLKLTTDASGLVTGLGDAKEKLTAYDQIIQDVGKSIEKKLKQPTDEAAKAAKEAAKAAKEHEEAVKKLTTTMQGVVVAIGAAIKFGEMLMTAWADAEKSAAQLSGAVKTMAGEYPGMTARLNDYAEQLQKTTGYDEELSKSLLGQAITMGRTEEQAMDLLKTAIDLDAQGIMPLNTAFESLVTTFDGLAPRNRMLRAMTGELTEEQLRNGDAVKIISERLGNVGEEMFKLTGGTMQGFKNALGEIFESMGRVISVLANPALSAFTGFMNKIADLITKTMDLKTAQDAFHDGVATNAQKLMVANAAYDEHIKKLVELDAEYKRVDEQSSAMFRGGSAEKERVLSGITARKDELKKEAVEWLGVRNAAQKAIDAEGKPPDPPPPRLETERRDTIDYYDTVAGKLAKQRLLDADYYQQAVTNTEALKNDEIIANEEITKSDAKLASERLAWLKSLHDADKKNADDRVAAEKQANDDVIASYKEYAGNVLTTVSGLVTQLQGIYDMDAQNKIDAIDRWLEDALDALDAEMQAELTAAGLSDETEREKLEQALEEAKASGDQGAIDEAQRQLDRYDIEQEYLAKKEALEKEAAQKRYEVELAQWKNTQAFAIVSAVIQGAVAIMTGFSQLGPIGGAIAAAVIAGILAVQIALIATQVPPPPPELAEGGIVMPRPGGTLVRVAEAGMPEPVIPLNRMGEVLSQYAGGGSAAGGVNQTNTFYVETELDLERATVKLSRRLRSALR